MVEPPPLNNNPLQPDGETKWAQQHREGAGRGQRRKSHFHVRMPSEQAVCGSKLSFLPHVRNLENLFCGLPTLYHHNYTSPRTTRYREPARPFSVRAVAATAVRVCCCLVYFECTPSRRCHHELPTISISFANTTVYTASDESGSLPWRFVLQPRSGRSGFAVARSLRQCSDAIFATTLYSDDVVQRSVLGVCVHSVFDTGRKAWEIGSTFMLFVSPRR